VHEELFRGTVAEARAHFGAARVRGELVLILPPFAAPAPERDLKEVLRELWSTGNCRAGGGQAGGEEFGLARSDVYRASLEVGEVEGRRERVMAKAKILLIDDHRTVLRCSSDSQA